MRLLPHVDFVLMSIKQRPETNVASLRVPLPFQLVHMERHKHFCSMVGTPRGHILERQAILGSVASAGSRYTS